MASEVLAVEVHPLQEKIEDLANAWQLEEVSPGCVRRPQCLADGAVRPLGRGAD